MGRAGGGGRPGGRGASRACPARQLRIACDGSERTARGGAVGGEGRKGTLAFSVAECIVHQAPERREPVQPPAVRARLGHNASTKELPPAPEPAKPRWGSAHSWPLSAAVVDFEGVDAYGLAVMTT